MWHFQFNFNKLQEDSIGAHYSPIYQILYYYFNFCGSYPCDVTNEANGFRWYYHLLCIQGKVFFSKSSLVTSLVGSTTVALPYTSYTSSMCLIVIMSFGLLWYALQPLRYPKRRIQVKVFYFKSSHLDLCGIL